MHLVYTPPIGLQCRIGLAAFVPDRCRTSQPNSHTVRGHWPWRRTMQVKHDLVACITDLIARNNMWLVVANGCRTVEPCCIPKTHTTPARRAASTKGHQHTFPFPDVQAQVLVAGIIEPHTDTFTPAGAVAMTCKSGKACMNAHCIKTLRGVWKLC